MGVGRTPAAPKFLPGTIFGSCGSRADANTGRAIYAPEVEYYRIIDRAEAAMRDGQRYARIGRSLTVWL